MLVCEQLLILFQPVKFSLRNITHLEEHTTSGGGLVNDDMSVRIRVSQFGDDLSVKLVGDRGVAHSSFERLAAICSGTSFILPLTKLNYANMEIKLSSEAGNLETLKPLNHS